jgi:putative intracellular protease/amidase
MWVKLGRACRRFMRWSCPRAIEGGLPELEAFERQARDSAPARLNWPAPKNAAEAIDAAEYDLAILAGGGPARHLVEVNASLARSLRGRWQRWHNKWTEADGLVTADAAALAALAEHRLTARAWSASSLQHFAACPYRFALHGFTSCARARKPRRWNKWIR